MTLPIEPCLPALITALCDTGQAVLQAPPGAGKTTRVPLALLDAGLCDGRILMLEPRRLAARSAAHRMADTLGEPVGQSVGYRMRGESKVSKATRIEVVTEGILTRMIQSDPELPGVSAVIFDEFHERSLNADFGLALCLEIRAALRPDLMILPMSATLDAGPVARLMGDAPIVTAEGRSFPVETHWIETPRQPRTRIADLVTAHLPDILRSTSGGVLVFLPGAGEIRTVLAAMERSVPREKASFHPLYGALPFKAQQAAIAPALPDAPRKVVLATSIAETSLTIPDVRVVVDAGYARRARFDPNSGMSRLVTERVTKAEATQRAGRAGRVAAGQCYRLWTKGEDGGLRPFPPPEIEAADLTGLALELAQWGATEGDLAFLTPPPAGSLAEARSLLTLLGILDDGRITPHGADVAKLPLHPRLGHMVITAGKSAAPLAALLATRDPLSTRESDMTLRLRAMRGDVQAASKAALQQAREEEKRIRAIAPDRPAIPLGQMAALAYPDRIGKRRKGEQPRYILSGGKGAILDAEDTLANQTYIVATDLDGDTREARVRLCAAISESDIRDLYSDRIETVSTCVWSKREGRVLARKEERLGAIALSDSKWTDAPSEAIAAAMCDGVRQLGLRIEGKAALFRARTALARKSDPTVPDMSEEVLTETLEDWLMPFLSGVNSAAAFRQLDITPALRAMLSWEQQQALDRDVPASFETPLGRSIAIDYSGDQPEITLRLQEMFGTIKHPTVIDQPLRVTLLSPAGRPLQTTTDIPAFWTTSYADVRKDMRGRYPRHPWPEDPTQADPTLRTKKRQV